MKKIILSSFIILISFKIIAQSVSLPTSKSGVSLINGETYLLDLINESRTLNNMYILELSSELNNYCYNHSYYLAYLNRLRFLNHNKELFASYKQSEDLPDFIEKIRDLSNSEFDNARELIYVSFELYTEGDNFDQEKWARNVFNMWLNIAKTQKIFNENTTKISISSFTSKVFELNNNNSITSGFISAVTVNIW